MRNDTSRLVAASLAGLAALLALVLALFDTLTAVVLLIALVGGWALVLAAEVGAVAYRKHRTAVLAAFGVVVLAALVLLRPDGARDQGAGEPVAISSYGAELWPNRLTAAPSFILRERVVGATAADGRANLDALTPGPLMREIRFVPGAPSGATHLELADTGEAVVVVNPIEAGVVHHVIGGSLSSVDLPIGTVARAQMRGLPDEIRVAYLVGAGRALAPVASVVTPLRRMPGLLALLLFVALGSFGAHAWRDLVVAPFRKRLTTRTAPPKQRPGAPGAARPTGTPIERAPLVPRRK